MVSDSHVYNRSAAKQSYYSTKSRTNYGIFNISFQGPNKFKENIKIDLLRNYLIDHVTTFLS